MVRTTKSEKTPSADATVEKKPKTSAKKTTTTAAVTAEVAEPTNEVVTENSSIQLLSEFANKIQHLSSILTTLKSDYKTLEKTIARELKASQKASGKKRKSSGNRQPSGFVKPTPISNELASFLGKAVGSEMARTEVSKEINAYIRSKSLQDKTNGRKIIPDAALTKLLNVGKGDELTYFNLQRYMKHHFLKPTPQATA
jgi:chromatin remodeling complex protein RSC6